MEPESTPHILLLWCLLTSEMTASPPEHPAAKGLAQTFLSALHTKELKDQNVYKGKI